MHRYDDDDDRPIYGSGGNYKIPDRDFYRKNFQSFSSVSQFLDRSSGWNRYPSTSDRPHFSSLSAELTPYAQTTNPSEGICCHFLRRGFTKPTKIPFTCAVWSSDSRWLVLGTQTGDLALWEAEGLKVNKIVSVPGHKEFYSNSDKIKEQFPITSMVWKKFDANLLVTGDSRGLIQYSDETFKNVFAAKDAHFQAVRGLSFSPLGTKLCSCGDDGKVQVWSLGVNRPDISLQAHQSDTKAVDWHPCRGLIASCSRDSSIKLWDPRQGKCLSTISAHKKSVNCCSWNMNGNWLASGSTDGLVKVYDIRTCKELEVWKGQNSEVCKIAWHPVHESLLVSGGYNGSLVYWLMESGMIPHSVISDAHRQSIDLIAWHPNGNLLATASHDSILKFWCREPPGCKLDNVGLETSTMENPPVVHYGPLEPDYVASLVPKPSYSSAALPAPNRGQTAQSISSSNAPSSSSYNSMGNRNVNTFSRKRQREM